MPRPRFVGRQTRRHSLRWRLPLLFSGLALLMLIPFLWLTNAEVKDALEDAAQKRAKLAAAQISGLLERSMERLASQGQELATDPTLRAYLRAPTAARGQAVLATQADDLSEPFRRFEVWNSNGELILARSTPGLIDSAAPAVEFPRGTAPVRAGISELKASGSLIYFEVVTEISGGTGERPALGYVRRFGRVVSSTAGPIRRLVGNDADIRIGSIGGNVWTNFESLVPAPPGAGSANADARPGGTGGGWVGAFTGVESAPWDIWVGFPRTEILAPARDVLRNLSRIALLFLIIGWILASILSRRLTRPLHDLAHATSEIAAGDFTRRVDANGRDEIGLLAHSFNAMTDRIAEALGALKLNNEQTHFALASARIAIWEVDLVSGALKCSESMATVLGRPEERLPADRDALLALVHEDDRETADFLLSGRASEDDRFVRYRVLTPAGNVRWIEGKGRVMQDDAARRISVLGVSIDVTEQTLLETQLRHAQKMDAVGQLAGGIAHDFNNLLTAIIGHGNLLLGEMKESDPAREDVVEMLKAADSATDLTRQLLAFSRRQVLEPQVIDLNEAVENTRNLLRRLIGERIDLVTALDAGTPFVRVDPGQLQQVLVNLAVNASDAMPGGGRLTIETANIDFTDTHHRGDEGIAPGRYVMVAVSDTGSGMDAETREHLFEPFFTTKPVGKGTGLGLATVFGIVKQSGGYIYVYSEVGHGSTFKVFLPATNVDGTRSELQLRGSAPTNSGETVLLVEDTEAVRTLAQSILEGLGYRVIVASSAEDALEQLERSGERPDLVVSDVIMAGMNGPDLVRELRRRFPSMRALFTSGYSREELGRRSGYETGNSFIGKPYTPTALAQKVREALNGAE